MTPEHYVDLMKVYAHFTHNTNPDQQGPNAMKRIAVDPATPTTSLERMEMARIPSGILTDRPKPEPGAAKSFSTTGWLAFTG